MMYLNSDSRLRVISLSAMVGQLSDTVATWGKTSIGKDKELMKYLKMSATVAQKAIKIIFDNLPKDELERCIKEANSANYRLTYTTYLPHLDKNENTFEVSYAEAMALSEAVIESDCKYCNGRYCDGHLCDDCPVRDMLLRWGIPPYNEVTDAQHPCPYSYKEV